MLEYNQLTIFAPTNQHLLKLLKLMTFMYSLNPLSSTAIYSSIWAEKITFENFKVSDPY